MKHWMGRPEGDAQAVERWNGRRWVPDDGKPARAFSGKDLRGFPLAWGPDCDCSLGDQACPHNRAMQHTCARFHAANGRTMKRPRKV